MKEDKNIDELFRDGMQKDYPVDSNLWASLESQLPSAPSRAIPWYFSLNSIALAMVLLMSATISTDTVRINPIKEVGLTKEFTSNQTSLEPVVENVAALGTEPLEEMKISSEPKINKNNSLNEIAVNTNKSTSEGLIKSKKQAIEYVEIESMKPEQSPSVLKGNALGAVRVSNLNDNKLGSNTGALSAGSSITYSGGNSLSKSTKAPFSGFAAQGENIELMTPKILVWNAVFSNYSIGLNPERRNANKVIQPPMKQQKLALEFVAMRSFNSEKMLSISDATLKEFKSNSETSQSNSRAGINLIRPYKFLSFGVGAHYSVQKESVRYKVNREELGVAISYDTTYRVVNSNFLSNGNPVLLIEKQINEVETPTFTLVEDYLYRTNTFKRLSVPLFVGIQKKYGAITAEVRAALVASYLFDNQGAYISRDLTVTEDFSQSNQIEQFVYGYQFNLSLGYQINELIGIGMRVGYEQDITSFTKQYDSKWRTQNAGLWLLYQPNW